MAGDNLRPYRTACGLESCNLSSLWHRRLIPRPAPFNSGAARKRGNPALIRRPKLLTIPLPDARCCCYETSLSLIIAGLVDIACRKESSFTSKMTIQSPRRLRIALIGLGRLGVIRARILAYQQPRIELVAVCDTKPGAADFLINLPPSVRFFADPEQCMSESGAEAVLISTATSTHAPLICISQRHMHLTSLSCLITQFLKYFFYVLKSLPLLT